MSAPDRRAMVERPGNEAGLNEAAASFAASYGHSCFFWKLSDVFERWSALQEPHKFRIVDAPDFVLVQEIRDRGLVRYKLKASSV